jgi:hypothetical protein
VYPETFANDLAALAKSALSQQTTRHDIFSIGTVAFEVTAPTHHPGDWLGRAFPSLRSPPRRNDKTHSLLSWDGTKEEAAPPKRPWGPSGHEPLGVINDYSNEAIRCAFDVHTSSLIVYDFRSEASFNWFPSIPQLPAWAKASPFRIVLSWLLNRNGMQMVHGAAVSIGNKAALLAGPGGAGKSTTALACALAGMGYLGDDYCAVEPSSGKVHMVYRTAKVLPTTVAMLPMLRSWLANRDRVGLEKGVIFLKSSDVELVRSAALSAIMIPTLAFDGRTHICPASPADAIRAILPSTIGGLMGGTSATPRAILQLVRDVPAFRLELGADVEALTSAISSHLLAG